jgi:hypothetical protein
MGRMRQLTLDGGEVEWTEQMEQTAGTPSRKLKKPVELWGITEDRKCGDCIHHQDYHYHNRHYHKCDIWHVSHSEATDIRVSWPACGKFEEVST